VPSPKAVPFPKKGEPPTDAEFLARLALPAGRKLESLRAFLGRQPDVSESLFYFGPRTGWAYRYTRGDASVATIMIHARRLLGIVALDRDALQAVDFSGLSSVATAARAAAHGGPSLSWLDLPLEGTGASDFKALVKIKLGTRPGGIDAPAPASLASAGPRRRPPPAPAPPPPPLGRRPPEAELPPRAPTGSPARRRAARSPG
jgi:hypothetical protein